MICSNGHEIVCDHRWNYIYPGDPQSGDIRNCTKCPVKQMYCEKCTHVEDEVTGVSGMSACWHLIEEEEKEEEKKQWENLK